MHPSIMKTPGRFTVTLGDGRAFTLDAPCAWDALDTVRDALQWEGRATCSRAAPGAVVNWPTVGAELAEVGAFREALHHAAAKACGYSIDPTSDGDAK